MKQLRGCPFCGGIANIHVNDPCDAPGMLYKIMCRVCRATNPWYDSEQKAKDKWNERVYLR
jgi:Lar family restriction alleviation protein